MAKMSKSDSFKNAVIDKEAMTITEVNKEDKKVFSLEDILTQWNGVSGVTLTIKTDDEIEPIEE